MAILVKVLQPKCTTCAEYLRQVLEGDEGDFIDNKDD